MGAAPCSVPGSIRAPLLGLGCVGRTLRLGRTCRCRNQGSCFSGVTAAEGQRVSGFLSLMNRSV